MQAFSVRQLTESSCAASRNIVLGLLEDEMHSVLLRRFPPVASGRDRALSPYKHMNIQIYNSHKRKSDLGNHFSPSIIFLSDNVRVVNGSNRCNGRVEVYQDGHWKRVCSSDWGKEEAEVVCQEIKCGTPLLTSMQNYGEAQGLQGIKTTCVGNETSITSCQLQEFKESCVDATVFCTSEYRLHNSTSLLPPSWMDKEIFVFT